MDTCRDCKWWDREDGQKYGDCNRQHFAEYGSALMWTMPADADIVTTEDFSCVQFERDSSTTLLTVKT